jgi:Kdo2-lipid IVA lauroyltransferase/acyltransferase
VKGTRGVEAVLARAMFAGAGAMPWRAALAVGARIGDLAHAFGLRRQVAKENLALAFPERNAEERERILRLCYREVGRVAIEYGRLAELAAAEPGRTIVAFDGLEHLGAALRAGRGAILVGAHFGNFELMGAAASRVHPISFVVQKLNNPGVEALIAARRDRAGMRQIPIGGGLRRIYQELRANRALAMLADQDARRRGVFVPFFGRPASTAIGPARIALATRAPLLTGFTWREPDGRHRMELEPPLEIEAPDAPDAALRLTALHVQRLERRIRERPEQWFWLHRRWKTRPAEAAAQLEPAAAGKEG